MRTTVSGRPSRQQRNWPVRPVPLLWLTLILVVGVLCVAAQLVWVYSGPEVCAPVMPAVENCFVADRWHSGRGGLVLVVLVAIATLAITGATTRRRWRVTFFVVGALAMTLVAVLTTQVT